MGNKDSRVKLNRLEEKGREMSKRDRQSRRDAA